MKLPGPVSLGFVFSEVLESLRFVGLFNEDEEGNIVEEFQKLEHLEHQKAHPETSTKGGATGAGFGCQEQGAKSPGPVLAPFFLSFCSLFALSDCNHGGKTSKGRAF